MKIKFGENLSLLMESGFLSDEMVAARLQEFGKGVDARTVGNWRRSHVAPKKWVEMVPAIAVVLAEFLKRAPADVQDDLLKCDYEGS